MPVSFRFGRRQHCIRGGKRRQPLLHFAFCTLPFALFFFLAILFPSLSSGQQPRPYASINHSAITYNGPGREASHDLPGTEVRIGLLLPLTGPRRAAGETLQRAAQMAVDDENTVSLPAHHLALVTRDESGPWGQASTQIVKLVFDDQAVALITSGEGSSAHLAEQMGNKIGVPIVTLASDPTTTEVNLPWIFRLGASDTAEGEVFARDIYEHRKLQKVLLLAQNDHDGRVGAEAFLQSAAMLGGSKPTEVTLDPGLLTKELAIENLASAEAVVIWSDAATANLLLAELDRLDPTVPLYLCRRAVENDSASGLAKPPKVGARHSQLLITAAADNTPVQSGFRRRYHERYGNDPGQDAAEAYDAVRIIAASLRQAGPNRARLRDSLAAISSYAGASGLVSFDHAGNDTSRISLLESR